MFGTIKGVVRTAILSDRRTRYARVIALFAHALTLTGGVLAFAAVAAAADRRFRDTFRFLFVALCIDAVDGTLARRLDVSMHWPRVDGERLDALIDFVTMVITPALVALLAGVLPNPAPAWAGVMIVASLVRFSRRETKSGGHFHFLPSCWYALVFYALYLPLSPTVVGACIVVAVAAMFTPGHYAHPALHETRLLHIVIGVPSLLIVASVLMGYLANWPWLAFSLGYVAFYVGQAFWLTLRAASLTDAPMSPLRRLIAAIIGNYPRPSFAR
ncbi:MAG TPA: CDP-alcohol phosphatidyltransferase family protein [Thermoanaerobaculia bacterium]|nr:CDP-alcohol phosphatidyltransferase family protein [Thermoanaerobaculia bacterium]